MPIASDERQRVSDVLQEFCETRIPDRVQDQIQLSFRFEGNSVFLVESRPPWQGPGPWTEMDVAKFRYFVGRREWQLYWADRNSKWHRCDWRGPAKRFTTLLREVDEDPTCIFWG